MTDDKRPRKWLISDDGRSFEILDGLGSIFEYKGAPPRNPVSVIERSAYDSLAERLKVAEEENKRARKEFDEWKTNCYTRDEHLQLVKESDKYKNNVYNLCEHLDNFRKRNVELAFELTLERSITAMLRKALDQIRIQIGYCMSGGISTPVATLKDIEAIIEKALASEKEMGK